MLAGSCLCSNTSLCTVALRSLSRVLGQEMHPVYLDEAGSIGRVMTKFGPTSNSNQSPNFYELLRLQLRNVQKTAGTVSFLLLTLVSIQTFTGY